MPLHPDIDAILAARPAVVFSSLSVEEARMVHAAGAAARPPGPVIAEVYDAEIAHVPVRVYRPADASGGTVIFFHGGGWVIGSIETHDATCRSLAEGSGQAVISVGYRLAPEHRFPAAVDDAVAVATSVLQGHHDGVDPTRVALAGDSAGGTLAAAAALACRDLDVPAVCAQLLIYPACDATMSSDSYRADADGLFLTPADMVWFYDHYRGDHPVDDWRLSPLAAGDLSGLPPALVITAEYDPLRDEGEAYAHALAAAGVSAAAVRYAGTTHGFFGWSHAAEPSRRAMAQATAWLRTAV